MTNHYIPPRGPDGKIPVDDMATFQRSLLSIDEPPIEQPAPAVTPRPRLSPVQTIGMVAVPIIIAAALLIAVFVITQQRPTPTPRPTARPDLPTATIPSPRPTPSAILSKAIVVYAAPEGQLLGAVDSTRAYTPTARYGESDWLQVEVAGSGKVWVHRADVQAEPLASLPDLAPPPTATMVPAPPAPVIVYAPPSPTDVPCPPFVGHARSIHGETWSCVSQADAEAQLAQIDQEAKK